MICFAAGWVIMELVANDLRYLQMELVTEDDVTGFLQRLSAPTFRVRNVVTDAAGALFDTPVVGPTSRIGEK